MKYKKDIWLKILFAAICISIYDSNNNIEIVNYEIKSHKIPKEFENFKILQLSDLHDKEFGKQNIYLIKKIKSLNPDIIVVTGDMLLRKKVNYNIFLNLAKILSKHYRIYVSLGNHEQRIRFKDKRIYRFLKDLKSMGIVVLNNGKAEFIKKNSHINIYGLRINLKYYRYRFFKKNMELESNEILNKLGILNKSEFNILLAHNPLYFKEYKRWGADLILSGHIHGGMIRLPVIGALLSPERTFFPKYSAGKYNIDNSTLIVNRGLGSGIIKLRIFNRPEISLITLKNI